MIELSFDEQAKEALQILQKGAFLTARHGEKANAMTIGWGYLGYAWGKPVFGVMVRHNRFTHELLEKHGQFTVTLPKEDMSKELSFCGVKSGRDTDKIAACGFSLLPGKTVSVPLIACKALQYECEVLCKTQMSAGALAAAVQDKWYSEEPGDYHTFYFGEIKACYES